MIPLRRPILFLLVFLICGIIFGAEKIFFLASIFICIFLYRAYKYWRVIFFALFFLLGAWRIEQSFFSHTNEPQRVVFSGVVHETSYTAGGNQRAVIRGTHPKTNKKIRIMAYIRPHQKHLQLGQNVTLSGELTPLSRAENHENEAIFKQQSAFKIANIQHIFGDKQNQAKITSNYNQFLHLRSQKIDATIFPEQIEIHGTNNSLTVFLREFRDKISAVYDEILPARESAVIKSMVLGDRLEMDADLADLYRVMGIFHILSISGLHITVIMLAMNKFLTIVMHERRAGLLVLCVMILYCLMTGAAVATVRAVLMGGILVGAKLFHRDYDLLASVAWACVILLLYEPLYLYSVGFQLSFGAVFGIGLLTAPIENIFEKIKLFTRNEKLSEKENILTQNEKLSEKENILTRNEKFSVNQKTISQNEKFSENEKVITQNEKLSESEKNISQNENSPEDEKNISQIEKLLQIFKKNLAVGIAAVLSTNIVFAHHFYEIPLYAVFGNLVIMPTVGIILVLGLAVGLVGLVFLPAAYFFSGAIFFILKFYEAAGVFFSTLPFAMILTGGGNIFVSALAVILLVTCIYSRRVKIIFASILILFVAIFLHANPRKLHVTQFENYTLLRKNSETLVIGAAHGGEEILLQHLKKSGKNRAEFFFTQPPRPQDAPRLERIIPHARAIYLPSHADGVTEVLMLRALEEINLHETKIIFLRDGDRRAINGTTVQFRALPLGRFEFEIN
ncbi:MAG: ComEC/Rec2 family competence protein [Defluviitaleaceae bacterium]|nr:ComEC/Rec2 family competence protein [Defluviitaleaceae bacterium]